MRVTIPQLAQRWSVSPRTILRWKRAGVNPADPEQVAVHVAKLQNPKLETLIAVKNEISIPQPGDR